MTSSPEGGNAYPPPTDFGRQLQSATPETSLVVALREHAARASAREATNFQLIMGLVGFGSGLLVFVPLVVWLATSGPEHRRSTAAPTIVLPAGTAPDAGTRPTLASAPLLMPRAHVDPRDAAPPPTVPAAIPTGPTPPPVPNPLDDARTLLSSGDILGARRRLTDAGLADNGEARFVLAESYDPNMLAALGIEAHLADAAMARRHYQAARDRGIIAAIKRLQALD